MLEDDDDRRATLDPVTFLTFVVVDLAIHRRRHLDEKASDRYTSRFLLLPNA